MSEISREDALAHFGVKGMKWGVRNEHRSAMRALDKQNKRADKAAQEKKILAARKRIAGGEDRRQLKTAKATYKQEKNQIGKYAAKKNLNKVRNKVYSDRELASMAANGQEAAIQALSEIGTILIYTAARAR